jgi:hypothetical protein
MTRRRIIQAGIAAFIGLPRRTEAVPANFTPVPVGAKRIWHAGRHETVVVRDKPFLFQTGFPSLDRLIGGGLPPSTMMMVTGVAGCGKTAFVSAVARTLGGDRIVTAETVPGQEGKNDLLFLQRSKGMIGGHIQNNVKLWEASPLGQGMSNFAREVQEIHQRPKAALVLGITASDTGGVPMALQHSAWVVIQLARTDYGARASVVKNRLGLGQKIDIAIRFIAGHGAVEIE